MLGQTISHYKVLEKLGEGDLFRVWGLVNRHLPVLSMLMISLSGCALPVEQAMPGANETTSVGAEGSQASPQTVWEEPGVGWSSAVEHTGPGGTPQTMIGDMDILREKKGKRFPHHFEGVMVGLNPTRTAH